MSECTPDSTFTSSVDRGLPVSRRDIIRQRAALDEQTGRSNARGAWQNIEQLAPLKPRMRVACYWAIRGELDLLPFLRERDDIQLCLPLIDEQSMRFVDWRPDMPMRKNAFNIPEPVEPIVVDFDEIDLVFAPLVMFDRRCHRIGMGGGYYDRYFARLKQREGPSRPLFIGVAHEFQRVQHIEPASWDVRLDAVITERTCYRRWSSKLT